VKIAIIVPFLTNIGGAEKVTGIHYQELSKKHDVTIYTSVYDSKVYPEYFKEARIIELMPWARKLPMFRTIVNLFWCLKKGSFLKQYDLVLAETPNSHVVASKSGKKTIWYSEHPNKVSYGLEKKNWLVNLVSKLTIRADQKAVKKIDVVIANSYYMKNIMQKIYPDKKIIVIYPPTELKDYKQAKSKDYFFCVSRLEPVKRIDTLIKVFNKTGQELMIAGTGMMMEELKAMANKNIKLLGRLSETELRKYYSECKAVIQLNKGEDFGLVPVEANASGKPVIAVNDGGFKETITNKTGVLINEPYEENLIRVLQNWHNKFKASDCKKNAERFGVKAHMKGLNRIIINGSNFKKVL
jgi:glycosyltransferase involved in cell wall biosynthesis